jgi:creatinine amidohydrolase
VLAARPDLVDMNEAVDENDYETFFEYKMDQYTESGVVGRGATKATAELGENLFRMVVNELVPMIKKALKEHPSNRVTKTKNRDKKLQ